MTNTLPKENSFSLQSNSNPGFWVRCTSPSSGSPKAILMIIHGMAEHGGRYQELARFLAQSGFETYAADHPGHGLTAGSLADRGLSPGRRGWETMLENARSLYTHIRKNKPDTPVYIMGHSMGSIIARHFTAVYPVYIQGLILSGTFDTGWLQIKFGRALSVMLSLLMGAKARCRWFNRLFYHHFNHHFRSRPTLFEWISSVREEVDAYVNDPYCGFDCSNGFYRNLFKGVASMKKAQHNLKYRKTLPLLILSGQDDPVGNFGKDALQIHREFYKQRYQNLSIKVFHGRHELLHEENKQAVMDYLLRWLESNMPGKKGFMP